MSVYSGIDKEWFVYSLINDPFNNIENILFRAVYIEDMIVSWNKKREVMTGESQIFWVQGTQKL